MPAWCLTETPGARAPGEPVSPRLRQDSGQTLPVRHQLPPEDPIRHAGRLLPDPSHGLTMFSYNSTHRVVVCRICKSCVIPGRRSQERHLRAKPHRLSGSVLKETVRLLSSYDLRTREELKEHQPGPDGECQLVEHLASY
jgi:hypothetical protein